MKIPVESVENKTKKWYKNLKIWIAFIILLLVFIIIIFTIILLIQRSKKDNTTHIHYTRINTNIYTGGYELYRLNILEKRNPSKQYELLANFLRASLFNQTNYEKMLPLCPIIYSMSYVDHPENWRGMLFGTTKFPNENMQHPYICYLSVLSDDRRLKLGSILLNQFITDIGQNSNPPFTHIQLHANWENCRAQKLYKRCGFRCNEFTLNGYSKPYEPEYVFGHMIRMDLNLANIKDIQNVCLNQTAIEISLQDEQAYEKLCNQNLPNGANQTCAN